MYFMHVACYKVDISQLFLDAGQLRQTVRRVGRVVDHNVITALVFNIFRENTSCESQLLINVNDFAKRLNYGNSIIFHSHLILTFFTFCRTF